MNQLIGQRVTFVHLSGTDDDCLVRDVDWVGDYPVFEVEYEGYTRFYNWQNIIAIEPSTREDE